MTKFCLKVYQLFKASISGIEESTMFDVVSSDGWPLVQCRVDVIGKKFVLTFNNPNVLKKGEE